MTDPTYRVELRAEGAGPPAIIRLRGWLKQALRSHGLRAVSVEEIRTSAIDGDVETVLKYKPDSK